MEEGWTADWKLQSLTRYLASFEPDNLSGSPTQLAAKNWNDYSEYHRPGFRCFEPPKVHVSETQLPMQLSWREVELLRSVKVMKLESSSISQYFTKKLGGGSLCPAPCDDVTVPSPDNTVFIF